MAQASTTLLIKTEGVTEGYKNIGKLLGPLQGINHMLYNLNKALGISSKESKVYKQSLETASNAGKKAADETKKLQSQLRAAAKDAIQLGHSAKTVNAAFNFNQITQALGTLKTGISSVLNSFMDLTAASEKQEAAEGRLANSLKNFNIKSNINDYKEWAKEIQNVTTFGDEFVLGLAEQSTIFAKNEKDIKRTTSAILDLSVGTGQNATDALQNFQRALNGNVRGLQQSGIYFSENEKKVYANAKQHERLEILLEKVSERYKGLAESIAQTPAGALQQIQNIIGDIKEKIGKIISVPLTALLKTISQFIANIDDLTSNWAQSQESVDFAIKAATIAMQTLQKGILVVVSAAATVYKSIQGWVYLIDIAKKGLGYLGKVGAAISGNFELWESSEKYIIDAQKELNKDLKETAQNEKKVNDILDKIAEAAGEMENNFAKALSKAKGAEGAKKYVQGAKDVFDTTDFKAKVQLQAEQPLESMTFGNIFGDMVFDSSKMELISAERLKIEQAYRDKLLNLEKTYIAQKQALEQMMNSAESPSQLQFVNEQKLAIEKEYQQKKHEITIEYATQTNDQLTLMQEKYYAKQNELQLAFENSIQQWQNNLKSNIEGSLTNAFENMFDVANEGGESFRETMYNSMKSLAKNVFTNSISTIIKNIVAWATAAGESQAGIPVVGPILAAAASGAVLATMGLMKAKAGKEAVIKYASGGYVSAGLVHGYSNTKKDSVSAMLAPGERVLSAKEAKEYDKNITENKNLSQIININISGQLSSPAQITDTVRKVLVPELRSAARAGYAI